MAQSKQREVDLVPALPVAGSITIMFYDAEGQVIPKVSFAPLGRINPNTIERYLPYIYQEIQREQVLERYPPEQREEIRRQLKERHNV